MDECRGKVHAQCCPWPATNAAFITKVAAWPTAQNK